MIYCFYIYIGNVIGKQDYFIAMYFIAILAFHVFGFNKS